MFWWAVLAAIGLTAVLIVVPWFLNPDYLKTLALQQIQRTFGPHVSVGQTSFALFPHPHFLVSDIVVKERPESHAVFRAQSMSLELGIGQLLVKKIVVREFVVDHPEIELRRDSQGDWRFLSHPGDDSPIAFLGKFLVMGKLVITGGKIILIDESPRDTIRGFVIEDVACLSETSHGESSVTSTIELSGKLKQTHGLAPFHIDGELVALLGTEVLSIGSRPVLFDQVTFSGYVRAEDVEVNQIGEYLPHGESLLELPGTLNVASQVKWVQNDKTSQLYLTNIGLSSTFITLGGAANFSVLEDGHQMMGFSMHTSTVDLEMIRQYVPKAWVPEGLVSLWDKGQWGGELDIAEARVTGSTREDVGTSITGTFRLNNGYVIIPDWPITEQIGGTVVVEPDRIQLSKVHGIYDGISVDVTHGVLLFKESGPWGDVEIQGPVPADKVLNFITGLGASSDFGVLKSWKILQGSGSLRLRFAGNLLESSGLKFQFGEYQPQDLVLHIPGLPHPLSHGHGKITFSRDSTVLEGIEGEVGIYPLSLNGTIAHKGESRFEPVNISAGFEGRDLLPVSAKPQRGGGLQLSGPLKATFTLTGPTRHPRIKGAIDGGAAFIDVPSVLKKQGGQEATLEFDGQFLPGGIVRFERVELMMLPLRLRGQGVLRYQQDLTWEARLDSGPVYLGLLPEGIQVLGNMIQSGILEVQLKGNGQGTDWTRWNTKGWVALTEGVMSIRGVQDPISNLFVRLKVDQNQLDLKRMEFRLKDSEALITGFMKDWKTKPVVSLMLDSPQFDIDLLIPKAERSAIRDGIEWLAAHGTLEGSVHIERPTYKNLSGAKLSAALKIHDNLISVDKLQTMVEEHGTVGGRFFIHLPQGKPAAMRVSFQASDLPFEKVLQMLGDEQRMITGTMSARGMIQGHGRDAEGVVPSLNGSVEFSLRDGYVRKGIILPRILAFLNLPNILRGKVDLEKTGFPFKKVSSKVRIEDGNFSTNNFLLNSSIMKVSAVGQYALQQDRLEGIAAVSPFGSYSDLLKNIPLFGRIFSGDRKGIATAIFSLTGPLGDPKVEYLPMESLKTGLTGLAQLAIDILKNTITLPYDLLKEANGEPSAVPSEPEPSGIERQK